MCIFLKNTPAKFHPDSMSNNGALSFMKRSPQGDQQQSDEPRYEISSWSKKWLDYTLL